MQTKELEKIVKHIEQLKCFEIGRPKEDRNIYELRVRYLVSLGYDAVWRIECAMLVGMELELTDPVGKIVYKTGSYDLLDFESLAELYQIPTSIEEGGSLITASQYMSGKNCLVEYLNNYLNHLEADKPLIARTVSEAIQKIQTLFPDAIIYTKFKYEPEDEVMFTFPNKSGYAVYYYTKGEYCGIYGEGETYDYVCDVFNGVSNNK